MKKSFKKVITCALAFVSGGINGLFSVGGGVLGVPMLYGYLGDEKAAHQNIAAFILPLSVLSAAVYSPQIVDNLFVQICAGAFLGGIAGSLFSRRVSLKYIKILFGIIVCYTGVKTIF